EVRHRSFAGLVENRLGNLEERGFSVSFTLDVDQFLPRFVRLNAAEGEANRRLLRLLELGTGRLFVFLLLILLCVFLVFLLFVFAFTQLVILFLFLGEGIDPERYDRARFIEAKIALLGLEVGPAFDLPLLRQQRDQVLDGRIV